jgi:2-oxoglutarate dehydrogenase E2 component (dihydrolipoamide succinyltransferase)
MNNPLTEIKVPSVGESVTEVEIGQWLKQEGDFVRQDETVVILESDKATVEVPCPVAGRMSKILKPKGTRVEVGQILAQVEPVEAGEAKLVAEIKPTQRPLPEPSAPPVEPATPLPAPLPSPAPPPTPRSGTADRAEEVVPMSLLRRKVAERLVQAQHTAALLTTFNEIDMSAVAALRKENQERFQERFQAKLGLMSFFVKATIEALKNIPQLNGEVRGTDIIFRNYFDIGIAIGSVKGLVVPVLRHAERMSFADIERAIADFAQRAKANQIRPEELQGGTFTITNGGVFGSLLSTPIINPPQSGVLGLHAIQDRPVAVNGQVVIRPMMYVALTYDHRLVDGREAITFLRHVKELVENPARILLEI